MTLIEENCKGEVEKFDVKVQEKASSNRGM
jgi:hypothetical protein